MSLPAASCQPIPNLGGWDRNCNPSGKTFPSSQTVQEIEDRVEALVAEIITESLEVLVIAFEVLHEETKPLRLQVSSPEIKVQGQH